MQHMIISRTFSGSYLKILYLFQAIIYGLYRHVDNSRVRSFPPIAVNLTTLESATSHLMRIQD